MVKQKTNMQELIHKVVILAYKDSPYLDECIASLRPSKYSKDMICCTSTPSPYIEKICKKYDVKLVVNDAPSGIASDWNFGLNQAKGGWVTLAHQDDIYHARYIQEIRNAILKHRRASLVSAWYQEVKKGVVRRWTLNAIIKYALFEFAFLFREAITSKRDKRRLLMFGNPIPCGGVTLNNTLGDLSFDSSYRYALDWKFWLDLAEDDGDFIFLRQRLIDIRIHEESTTVTLMAESNIRQQEELKIFSMLWPKWAAKIIFRVYTLSHLSNRIQS